MIDQKLLAALLDSLKEPILFADTDHTIRYMNAAAVAKFKQGESFIGRSLLACHKEDTQRLMVEILAAMREGEEERLVTDNEKRRAFMRAVRDEDGQLVGYYQRYEPPQTRDIGAEP